jgi:hypothetical protein
VPFRHSLRPITPAHWSKDFVEHLRTVHLALIATAAALVVVGLTTKRYSINDVANQIRVIEQMRKSWPKTLTALASSSLLQEPVSGDEDDLDWIPVTSEPLYGTVKTETGKPRVYQFMPPKEGQEIFDFAGLRTPPDTIAEFEDWWDGLAAKTEKVYVPKFIELNKATVYSKSFSKMRVRLSNVRDGSHWQPRHVDGKIPLAVRPNWDAEDINTGFMYFGDDDFVSVSFRVQHVVVDLNDKTLSKSLGVLPGRFHEVFRQLREFAKTSGIQSLPALDETLSKSDLSDTPVFEAFGIKFPAGMATLGGAFVLLSVQLYFFLYLRKLSGRLKPDDPGWDVPWIGMDAYGLARSVFMGTVVLLPVVSLVVLSRETVRVALFVKWDRTGILKTLVLLLAMMLSLLLGISSWKHRPQLSSSASSPEPSTSESGYQI